MASSESEFEPPYKKKKQTAEMSQSTLFEKILSTPPVTAVAISDTPRLPKRSSQKKSKVNVVLNHKFKQPNEHSISDPIDISLGSPLLDPHVQQEPTISVPPQIVINVDETQTEPTGSSSNNEDSIMIVSTKDLSDLRSALDHQKEQIDLVLENQDGIRNMLEELNNSLNEYASRINAKVEGIATSTYDTCMISNDGPLSQPVKNETELNELEESSKKVEFVQAVLTKFGRIFGKGVGGGGTVALQLIYLFFSKEF